MTKLIVNVVVIAAATKERVGANWTTTIDSFEAVRICIYKQQQTACRIAEPV
jgi:hypothetical protein